MLDSISKLALKDPDLLRQANCIGGQWVQADSGKTFAVRNPATGEVVGNVPAMGKAETRRAIEAAELAFEKPNLVRAAIDAKVVKPDALIANAQTVALFPPMTGG